MSLTRRRFLAALGAIFAGLPLVRAAGVKPEGGRGGGHARESGERPAEFHTDTPATAGEVVLARPTDRSVTLSVRLAAGGAVRVEYAPAAAATGRKVSAPVTLKPGEPGEIVLAGLSPDTAYSYRLLHADNGAPALPEGGVFRTRRAPGAAFTFTLIADSHLDENCLPSRYAVAMANVAADKPDFHIDLGDTFMTGKYAEREAAVRQYDAQRHYFGLIGNKAPVFFVIGNHDGEEVAKGGGVDLAVWSCLQRKRRLPNPEPDVFYSGNAEKHPAAGMLQNYYAWTWGDALFVVLDPYWTSRSTRGGKEPWGMTLGKAQYDWLARTLRGSKAKYKFVFIHQLVGGLDRSGRGGVEAAGLYEWGGREKDGADTFAKNRPGWDKPIHALLVETGVNILFHGHDHFYARQELDGVVYQLAPQPGPVNDRSHRGDEYGYTHGILHPSGGHLRVSVAPEGVTVDYVRAATPASDPEARRSAVKTNGEVTEAYTLKPKADAAR